MAVVEPRGADGEPTGLATAEGGPAEPSMHMICQRPSLDRSPRGRAAEREERGCTLLATRETQYEREQMDARAFR